MYHSKNLKLIKKYFVAFHFNISHFIHVCVLSLLFNTLADAAILRKLAKNENLIFSHCITKSRHSLVDGVLAY